jgi:hypothetical protein
MSKNPVTNGNGGELAEHGLRELTNDETALVDGAGPSVFGPIPPPTPWKGRPPAPIGYGHLFPDVRV